MKDTDNILYSIIPLILIILFSWLFSLLGSKMRKQGKETEATGEKSRGYQLMDLLLPDKPESGPAANQLPGTERPAELPQPNLPVQMPKTAPGSPPVTAKPIEPKWWGA